MNTLLTIGIAAGLAAVILAFVGFYSAITEEDNHDYTKR